MTGRDSSGAAAAASRALFVIHAEADGAFVRGYLLPALGLPPDQVQLSSELPLGGVRIDELSQAIATSRTTAAVLSWAYLADRWAVFGEQLAGHSAGPSAGLIPILREPCALPLRLDFRVALDLSDPARWDAEIPRLRRALEVPAPPRIELENPYPGLAAFSTDTAAHFFGRDAELDEMLDGIAAGRRELYLVGPSGSGKSSLLAAGLAARLERGDPRIGAPYRVRRLRPGAAPADALREALGAASTEPADVTAAVAACLAATPARDRLLVVIDQLEELFTQAADDQRGRFAAMLRTLRADPRCAIAHALRADFYGHLMASELWTDLGPSPWQINVLPLRGDRLRAAITRPLEAVVWHSPDRTSTGTTPCHVDPRLVDRLVLDAAQEPSALPLVQKALERIWNARRACYLPLEPYAALGGDQPGRGLAAAFEQWAEATIAGLRSGDEVIARRTFLRLVSFGRDGHAGRRRRTADELRDRDGDPAAFARVLDALVASRLVTVDAAGAGAPPGTSAHDGERSVELAHESLMSSWKRYRAWIQAHRPAAGSLQILEDRARDWVAHGRGKVGLLDREQVVDARRLLTGPAGHDLGSSPDLDDFVHRSAVVNRVRRIVRAGLISSVALGGVATAGFAAASQVSAELQPRPTIVSTHAAVAEYVEDGAEAQELRWLIAPFDCQDPATRSSHVLGRRDGLVMTALVKLSDPDDALCARFRPDWDATNPVEVCRPTSGMLVASLSLPGRTGGFSVWIEVYRDSMIRNLFADHGTTHSVCSIEVKDT